MSKRKRAVTAVSSDLENPGTWPRYKKGMCETCNAGCCMLVVEITAKDLIRLGLTDPWEVENCLKELIKRLKKEGTIKRYNFKTARFVLEQKGGADCIFLDKDRNCSVYANRPDVCRDHPLVAGPRKGFCPYSPML